MPGLPLRLSPMLINADLDSHKRANGIPSLRTRPTKIADRLIIRKLGSSVTKGGGRGRPSVSEETALRNPGAGERALSVASPGAAA
jgi:hypothetical protein